MWKCVRNTGLDNLSKTSSLSIRSWQRGPQYGINVTMKWQFRPGYARNKQPPPAIFTNVFGPNGSNPSDPSDHKTHFAGVVMLRKYIHHFIAVLFPLIVYSKNAFCASVCYLPKRPLCQNSFTAQRSPQKQSWFPSKTQYVGGTVTRGGLIKSRRTRRRWMN